MWLFTKHGFYSAICARQGAGSHGQLVDLDRIVVQARIQKEMRRFDFVEEEEWFDENLRTRASSA